MHRYVNKTLTIASGLVLLFSLFSGCTPTERYPGPRKAFARQEAAAEWVTSAAQAPGLEHRTFHSAAVGSEVSYHIYVPEAYRSDTGRALPVIYWLHGLNGGMKTLPRLASLFDRAIRAGQLPPMLIVFPNGLPYKLWVDSKNGRFPVETMFVKELVPHIDASFRTLATRKGRMLEGFSMGGFGAARFGFKYPEIFSAVSLLAPGPMQKEFSVSEGPRGLAAAREKALQDIFGGDQQYFKAQSPWSLAEQYAAGNHSKIRMRIVVGGDDPGMERSREFADHLTRLNIPHTFSVLPGVGHNLKDLLKEQGNDRWNFYRSVVDALTTTGSESFRLNGLAKTWPDGLVLSARYQ